MTATKTPEQTSQGLAGVIAGDSSICLCGAEDESLLYRGYTIEDLATHSTFEEVAWLLLHDDLPTKQELEKFRRELSDLFALGQNQKDLLESIPAYSHPMDVLRTAVSFVGNLEPNNNHKTPVQSAQRLLAVLPSILLYWWHFHKNKKQAQISTSENTIAGQFLHLLYGKPPTELQRKALDAALILYAEHEFNASTFTVRTIASTLSDYYSAIVGGIGALRGSLHGGANEYAMALIEKCGTPQNAEKVVRQLIADKQLIMGFGHRVYKRGDPRSKIIKEWARKLAENTNNQVLFQTAERIEEIMLQEKKLFPNLDFYSALVFKFLNIPPELFTPIFVMSRTSGWSAHYIEQHNNNKLIRPLSHYVGPHRRHYTTAEKR